MSPARRSEEMSPAARAALSRMAVEIGQQLREERCRRGWTLRRVAERAGVSLGLVHNAETGGTLTLESYARLAVALGLRPSLVASRADARAQAPSGGEDLVHAAMGELEARALERHSRAIAIAIAIAIDEPYQHYQFAGRADVLAWDRENLLHIENRTRFPNLQEAAGAYNAKRRYLPRALAERLDLGPRGWRSVTHVMACAWSAEVLHVLRLRRASFNALCPDPPDALEAWLSGAIPGEGVTSTLVLLDPLVPFGSRRRTIVPMVEPPLIRPRHRGYADIADALRRAM